MNRKINHSAIFVGLFFLLLVYSTDAPGNGCTGSSFSPVFSPACACWQMAALSISDCDLAYSYDWDFGDGTVGSGENACHFYSTPGTYTVTFIFTGLCHFASMTCQVSRTIVVTSAHLSATPFSLGNDTTVQQFPFVINPDSSFDAYLWSTGDSTPTLSVSQPGTYSLTVTDFTGCSASDTISIGIFTNSDSPPFHPVQIYPNPSNGEIIIRAGAVSGKFKIRVIDVLGKVCCQEMFTGLSGFVKKMDLSRLGSGVFLFEIESNGEVFSKKIIFLTP